MYFQKHIVSLNRVAIKTICAILLALVLPVTVLALTDNINLPFKSDSVVIGRWQTVAYVQSPEDFVPERIPTNADLFLKEMVFLPHGKTSNAQRSWTQGVLINSGDKTASKYVFKDIGRIKYMFLEWKTGDYVLRNRQPGYYVLIRDSDLSKEPKERKENLPEGDFTDCLVPITAGGVCKHPGPSTVTPKPMNSLPRYDSTSEKMWQLDLRGQNISKLALVGRTTDLLHADFDTRTRFPNKLPEGFSPEKILEFGKNPGLGIRELHKEGITGKGVSIAIIDQALLIDHKEYSGRVRSYEELHWLGLQAQASMHGAVASISVGKDSGVAPKADLYYIATWFADSRGRIDYAFLAKAIDRVTAFNQALPKEKKIRALLIARGFAAHEKGYAEVAAAIEKARKSGIFVVTSSLEAHYGFRFNGLGREPMSDPDVIASYSPGLFWQRDFFLGIDSSTQTLLVPMDSRTAASPTGVSDYVFYREGGWSWAIPYIAGLYALACQVSPDITPEVFWKKALDTGDSLSVKKNGRDFRLERIVNPQKLIKSLKE